VAYNRSFDLQFVVSARLPMRKPTPSAHASQAQLFEIGRVVSGYPPGEDSCLPRRSGKLNPLELSDDRGDAIFPMKLGSRRHVLPPE
jgi:hypothetical protein